MKYEAPSVELMELMSEDVILASVPEGGGDMPGGGEDAFED